MAELVSGRRCVGSRARDVMGSGGSRSIALASGVVPEFGIFTEVKDLRSALAVLDQVAHPLRALLVDPIHVDRSGSSLDEIAAVDPALLPYAQFCDARTARPDPADFEAVIIDAIDLRE